MADQKLRNLLTAAKEARTALFRLMLAEQAQRVRGAYTDIHQRLDKAIREVEQTPKSE